MRELLDVNEPKMFVIVTEPPVATMEPTVDFNSPPPMLVMETDEDRPVAEMREALDVNDPVMLVIVTDEDSPFAEMREVLDVHDP